MCLIAYAPKKSLISLASLSNAYDNNKDGWGICYQDTTEGRVMIIKEMSDFERFKEVWANDIPDDVPVGVHFRWRTHGDLGLDNIHPYTILSKDAGDPIDLVLMHNGVISYIHKSGDKRSDTQMYVDLILQPMLRKAPMLYKDDSFQFIIERDIGKSSKFLLFPSPGDDNPVCIYNKESGHEEKDQPDVWYSNYYSIKTNTYRTGKTSVHTPYTPPVREYKSPYYSQFDNDDWEHWHDTTPAKSTTTSTVEPVHRAYMWPTDMTKEEEDVKKAILEYMDKEYPNFAPIMILGKKYNKVGKVMLSFGWFKCASTTEGVITYDMHLSKTLKEFEKRYWDRIEAEEKAQKAEDETNEKNIFPMFNAEQSKNILFNSFNIFSKAEILETIQEEIDIVVDYMIERIKFTGGKQTIKAWIEANTDRCCDLIYDFSRSGKFENSDYVIPDDNASLRSIVG